MIMIMFSAHIFCNCAFFFSEMCVKNAKRRPKILTGSMATPGPYLGPLDLGIQSYIIILAILVAGYILIFLGNFRGKMVKEEVSAST